MADLTFGAKVRERRELLRLTREELAEDTGTSVSTIARLELLGHEPRMKVIKAIASRFDVTIADLVDEKASA